MVCCCCGYGWVVITKLYRRRDPPRSAAICRDLPRSATSKAKPNQGLRTGAWRRGRPQGAGGRGAERLPSYSAATRRDPPRSATSAAICRDLPRSATTKAKPNERKRSGSAHRGMAKGHLAKGRSYRASLAGWLAGWVHRYLLDWNAIQNYLYTVN